MAGGALPSPGRVLPKVIKTKHVPVYVFAREMEAGVEEQLIALASLPFVVGYVSAMPDVHVGIGATVGSVFATRDYVIPNAVGVDIGCGMIAVPVKNLHADDVSVPQLRRIHSLLRKVIPTGFESHKKAPAEADDVLHSLSVAHAPSKWLQSTIADNTRRQIGTLGGGNHFIELCCDEEKRVWMMLHSGSRNIGNTTAQHYNTAAMAQMERTGHKSAGKAALNFLHVHSQEGDDYLKDMLWCQAYAAANRAAMIRRFDACVAEVTGRAANVDRMVNVHHNFCRCEECTYTDPRTGHTRTELLWVTRKGATSAAEGQYGIIPGSMGSGSYIVKGRGNALSWQSCSHGAGRKMSRTSAKAAISQREFEESMKGIVCDTHPELRDEAPQAYKDLNDVMANQADLVDIQHRLRPLLNLKGFGKPWQRSRNK